MDKICSHCKLPKDTDVCFGKNRARSDGLQNQCKQCRTDEYNKNKPPLVRVKRDAAYWREYQRVWSSAYYKSNTEKRRKAARDAYHRTEDKSIFALKARERRLNNTDEVRFYDNNRYRNNSLPRKMSIAIRGSVKRGTKRNKSWETLVGYTTEQLRTHIEKQFSEGMNWEEFKLGNIHIDHIIPKSVFIFDSPEDFQFKQCWKLSNLRPMWATENIKKGNKLLEPFQQYLI